MRKLFCSHLATVSDGLKKTLDELKKATKKGSSIVSSIKQSTVATEYLRSKRMSIEMAVVTGRNS